MDTKVCAHCGEQKPFDEFYKNSKSADGKFYACKPCHCRASRNYMRTNPEIQRRRRERQREPQFQEYNRLKNRRWRAANPEAVRAHRLVRKEIKEGRMKRDICAICGATENIQGHHKDYAKPLEVVWLCARCHARIHAVFPELEGTNKLKEAA